MTMANPITEMRRLDKAGDAYVVNWIAYGGDAKLFDDKTPGLAVVAYDDEWLIIANGEERCYIRWAHISSIYVIEV